MADNLTVRFYNVRFGDAILVTVPDRSPTTGKTTLRRILIDVGNAPKVASPEGGDDTVFDAVIEDILETLDGKTLDLYVMTHEHLDHVQGLPFAGMKLHPDDFKERFKVRRVWLTASAAPDYYDRFENARKQKLAFEAMHRRLARHLAAEAPPGGHGLLELLANNDPTKTKQCVEFLRQLNPAKTRYLHRGVSLTGAHLFKEAKFEIWAPEEDTSDYYGHFQPLAFGDGGAGPLPDGAPAAAVVGATPAGAARAGAATAARATAAAASTIPAARPGAQVPPAGVDVGAFLNLMRARRNGIADNLLAIDRAANNTSIVFLLEWRGWRLLFPGDAEIRSWKTMAKHGVLKPVHFLKVAHHGSHNGTPDGEIFDAILPAASHDGRNRLAAVSTWTDTYSGIPHTPTDERIKQRAELFSILDDKDELFFDLEFPG